MTDNRPRWLAAMFVVLLGAPVTAIAQGGLPLLDDASLVPRGLVRLRVPQVWTRYEQRFGNSGTVDLGAPYTSDSLGALLIPPLATTQSLIQSAAASPFSLSLGKSRLDAMAKEEHTPITLEYGVFDRLSVSVMVPIVRKHLTGLLRLDSLGANVGPNPQRLSAAAVTTNGQVQTQFTSAASQLQGQLNNCTLGPAGCANLAARQAEAQQLILDSQSFAATVGNLYGKTGSTGEAFVPRSSSTAQTAIAARVADFNLKYKDLLSQASDLITAIPVGAAGPAGSSNLASYVLNDLGRDTISSREVYGVGDWELGVKYLVINRVRDANHSLRVLLASTVSFASGTREAPVGVADLTIGNGAVGVDVRAITEWKYGRAALIAAGSSTTIGRNASMPSRDTRWLTSELEPRWHVSAPLAIHGSYAMRVGDLSGGTHYAGGGVSFTTVSSFRRGDRPLPMEMRYSHLEAIKGAVGAPKFSRDQVEVRIYYQPR